MRWLNTKHGCKIPVLPICKDPILDAARLAGFIDADGSFAVRQTSEKTGVKKLVECQMTLVQRALYKKTNESVLPLFEQIAHAFKINVTVISARKNTVGEQYKIKVTSIKSKAILRSYLAKYPLLTSKYYDYQNWCMVDDLMKAKQHYKPAGHRQIKILKDAIGSREDMEIEWVRQ